jgi:hypothetical protein
MMFCEDNISAPAHVFEQHVNTLRHLKGARKAIGDRGVPYAGLLNLNLLLAELRAERVARRATVSSSVRIPHHTGASERARARTLLSSPDYTKHFALMLLKNRNSEYLVLVGRGLTRRAAVLSSMLKISFCIKV